MRWRAEHGYTVYRIEGMHREVGGVGSCRRLAGLFLDFNPPALFGEEDLLAHATGWHRVLFLVGEWVSG